MTNRGFLVACIIAGALAVPAHAVWTPVAAAIAGLVALLGFLVWRWSGLPRLVVEPSAVGASRFTWPLLWLGLGFAVGLVLLAVIRFVIQPAVPDAGARMAAAGALPVWRRALIIYVAAVAEETIFRLLLLSLAAGLIRRMFRSLPPAPTPTATWFANAIAALAFGAVHLPSWMAIGHLGAGLALMVMSMNGVGGLVFGHVFVRRGIVAAAFVHAGADCAIQLVGPLT